jgi:hypothetical protein
MQFLKIVPHTEAVPHTGIGPFASNPHSVMIIGATIEADSIQLGIVDPLCPGCRWFAPFAEIPGQVPLPSQNFSVVAITSAWSRFVPT